MAGSNQSGIYNSYSHLRLPDSGENHDLTEVLTAIAAQRADEWPLFSEDITADTRPRVVLLLAVAGEHNACTVLQLKRWAAAHVLEGLDAAPRNWRDELATAMLVSHGTASKWCVTKCTHLSGQNLASCLQPEIYEQCEHSCWDESSTASK